MVTELPTVPFGISFVTFLGGASHSALAEDHWEAICAPEGSNRLGRAKAAHIDPQAPRSICYNDYRDHNVIQLASYWNATYPKPRIRHRDPTFLSNQMVPIMVPTMCKYGHCPHLPRHR
jgi:hypothetical protein